MKRLSDMTTFRLGGPCPEVHDCAEPDTCIAVLRDLHARSLSCVFLGGGSNVLASDEGIDLPVVRYVSETVKANRDGSMVQVTGSSWLDDTVSTTVAWGLDGLVMCSGIPGTVGGAIAGNAGAFGQQIGDRLVEVTVCDRAGRVSTRTPSNLDLGYRSSNLIERGEVVLTATLGLTPADSGTLAARREEILAFRRDRHPDWRNVPTAGSFFKNIEPTSNAERRQAAGWYLEKAGALTLREGGARTFLRHANIIIAEPPCTALEVWTLAHRMALAVRDQFGIALQREVRLIGHFPDAATWSTGAGP
ncbi:MAG: FAD-binding protein [Kiritimatiellae bacterium]|nr:FAD-binding protein [Kiritimatiellia bacterium]